MLLIWALMRSPWGRVLQASVRTRTPPRALGKNVLAFKMQSLILGGVDRFDRPALCCDAAEQSAQTGEFATHADVLRLPVVVLGGLGRVKGPIVGTIIFFFVIQFVDNILIQLIATAIIPEWIMRVRRLGSVDMLAGLTLGSLMIFRPQGIFGDKREIGRSMCRPQGDRVRRHAGRSSMSDDDWPIRPPDVRRGRTRRASPSPTRSSWPTA